MTHVTINHRDSWPLENKIYSSPHISIIPSSIQPFRIPDHRAQKPWSKSNFPFNTLPNRSSKTCQEQVQVPTSSSFSLSLHEHARPAFRSRTSRQQRIPGIFIRTSTQGVQLLGVYTRRRENRPTSLLNRSAGRFIAMRQPNFSQLYFRLHPTHKYPLVGSLESLTEIRRGRERWNTQAQGATIGVANLHVFHIRGRPFSSDLDAARYVVKHMAFNARGIAHGSEERVPLIFGSHANCVFLFRPS